VSAPGQDAKVSHRAQLVRSRSESRPHSGHAESAATGHERKYKVHSITSSARARIEGGIVIPGVLAIFRLTIRSILVGSWTGRSEGLAPLRILVDVTGALAENGFDVRHVTQETACIAKKHARQTVLARKVAQTRPMAVSKRRAKRQHGFGVRPIHRGMADTSLLPVVVGGALVVKAEERNSNEPCYDSPSLCPDHTIACSCPTFGLEQDYPPAILVRNRLPRRERLP